jgi:hypothetical protein
MASTWDELTALTGSREIVISRVLIKDKGIALEGEFELPPLAKLAYEDQVFVAQFVRTHGSIKEMEQLFGVSYPTIKSRLNRIGGLLQFIDVREIPNQEDILGKLERGEIGAKEAAERLRG